MCNLTREFTHALEINEKQQIMGSSINHVVTFLGIFDPPPPSWSLLLNKAYVIKWSFGQPPSPLNCPRGLWMSPKCIFFHEDDPPRTCARAVRVLYPKIVFRSLQNCNIVENSHKNDGTFFANLHCRPF